MVIALILLIPIMSISTGYMVLKAYSKGIQHNYQLSNRIEPREEKNPVQSYIEHRQEVKQEKEQQTIMDEWLNGAKE